MGRCVWTRSGPFWRRKPVGENEQAGNMKQTLQSQSGTLVFVSFWTPLRWKPGGENETQWNIGLLLLFGRVSVLRLLCSGIVLGF